MNRIQTACYCLIASAFILAGLLVAQLGDRAANPAQASMVIARDNFTLMTAKSRKGEESLFVLDNTAGRLMIYRLNLGKKRLELAANADLNNIFDQATRSMR